MSVLVKHRKKDNMYRFWTTISDGWLSNWLTKWQAVEFLQRRVMDRAKDDCEEIKARFPSGYSDMNYKMIRDEKAEERYKKLLEERISG